GSGVSDEIPAPNAPEAVPSRPSVRPPRMPNDQGRASGPKKRPPPSAFVVVLVAGLVGVAIGVGLLLWQEQRAATPPSAPTDESLPRTDPEAPEDLDEPPAEPEAVADMPEPPPTPGRDPEAFSRLRAEALE